MRGSNKERLLFYIEMAEGGERVEVKVSERASRGDNSRATGGSNSASRRGRRGILESSNYFIYNWETSR